MLGCYRKVKEFLSVHQRCVTVQASTYSGRTRKELLKQWQRAKIKINPVIHRSSVDYMNKQLEVGAPVPSVPQHTKKIIHLISLVTTGAIIYPLQRDF